MFIIHGTHNQRVSVENSPTFTQVKYRRWFSLFFVPLIPFAHIYFLQKKNSDQVEQYMVPILPVVLLMNVLCWSGLAVTHGLWWLAFLFASMILAVSLINTGLAQVVLLVSLVISEVLVYRKTAELAEKYQKAKEHAHI